MNKDCPPNKIRNPKNGKCVKLDSIIGRKIAIETLSIRQYNKLFPCPEGKIRNPMSGRCVNIKGKIGSELINTMKGEETLDNKQKKEEKPKPFSEDNIVNSKLLKELKISLNYCKRTLAVYQKTDYLKNLGKDVACEILPIITQQLLWLIDRHEEFLKIMNDPNYKKRNTETILLINTIQGQCKNATKILSGFGL